jgi:DNA-directed RNA polymerase specialized sigma24 family protein
MFRINRAPPFVPSDPNAPAWMLKIEKKKFLGEWRTEQRRRQQLLKKGLPVPPMPDKFQFVQTAENAELTGYRKIFRTKIN